MNRKYIVRIAVVASLLITLMSAFPSSAQEDMREVVIHSNVAFTTLDTMYDVSLSQRTLLYGIHDGLLTVDDAGNIVPSLAESFEISDDGLTLILNLREGVQFHDGTTFNAEAVVWNIRAGQDPDIGPGALSAYASIESVEALDEYTVQITLSEPDANILNTLAGETSQTLIASPTAYESMGPDEYAQHPVGTGPFEFVSWEPGVELVVEANEDYWGEDKPNFDRAIWRVIIDDSAAVLNMQSGDIDVMHYGQTANIPILEDEPDVEIETYTSGYATLSLNTQKPPFDNVHNRRAVYYALDVQPIIDLVYNGYADPGQAMLPPPNWAYDPSTPVISRDLDKAREELTAAGNPEGFDFEVTVVAQPARIQTLEIMQAELAEVGITLNIQANERARHIEIIRSNPNEAEAAYILQNQAWLSAERFYTALLGCQPTFAFVGYCTEEFDALEQSMKSIYDQAERKAVLDQMGQIYLRDVPVIIYVYPEVFLAYRSDRVESVGIDPLGLLDWTHITMKE